MFSRAGKTTTTKSIILQRKQDFLHDFNSPRPATAQPAHPKRPPAPAA